MIRNKTVRGLLLACTVVLSVVAGATAVGPVMAQGSTNATNDTNATTDTNVTTDTNDTNVTTTGTTDTGEGSPEIAYVNGSDGLRARFADADANTVESIPQRTINFNIVNTQYDGPYTVTITATGMEENTIEQVVYANETGLSRFGLSRYDVIGFDFSDTQPGSYEITASPVSADASVTVPIEIVGQNQTGNETGTGNQTEMGTQTGNETGMDNQTENGTEMGNQTGNGSEMGNQTENGMEMGNQTGNETGLESAIENVTLSPVPSGANATANHTLRVSLGADAGNLSGLAIDYGESNATLSGVGMRTVRNGSLVSSDGSNVSIVPNVTSSVVGFDGDTLTFEFDGGRSLNASAQLVMTYGGVTNPPATGEYDVSVQVNPNTTAAASANTTLNVSEANASLDDTGADTDNETEMGGNATDETTDATATTEEGNETSVTTTTNATTTEETTEVVEETEPAESTEGDTTTSAEDTTTDSGTQAGGPGFGVLVTLVAVLAVALVAARRRVT